MTTRATADVEALLRRTYAEVADRTHVSPREIDDDHLILLRNSTVTPATRWPSLFAAAIVVAVAFGALAWIRRDDADGRSLGQPEVGYLLPIFVPDGLPLVEIRSSADGDRVVYASDAAAITITVHRGPGAVPSADTEGVATRRRDVGATTAVVQASGKLPDGTSAAAAIDQITDWLAVVPEDLWSDAIANGGFGADRSGASGVSEVRRSRTANGSAFRLEGTPQTGLILWHENNGWSGATFDACHAELTGGTTERPLYSITGPPDVEFAEVVVGGETRRVSLDPAPYGLPFGIATLETATDDVASEATCIGSSS